VTATGHRAPRRVSGVIARSAMRVAAAMPAAKGGPDAATGGTIGAAGAPPKSSQLHRPNARAWIPTVRLQSSRH